MINKCVQRRFVEPINAKHSKVEPSIMALVDPSDKLEALILCQVGDVTVTLCSTVHRQCIYDDIIS